MVQSLHTNFNLVFTCLHVSLYTIYVTAQSLHVFFVQWGRGSANYRAKSSGRTFEKLYDIRKYAHLDFLAEVQCNLGGRTIERVR